MATIDVTGVDLVKLTQEAYARSIPQGLGFLHFTDGPLPEAEARRIVDRFANNDRIALSLDYVRGRACKLTVFREGDRLEINDRWFDHSASDLDGLLAAVGIARPAKAEAK